LVKPGQSASIVITATVTGASGTYASVQVCLSGMSPVRARRYLPRSADRRHGGLDPALRERTHWTAWPDDVARERPAADQVSGALAVCALEPPEAY